MCTAFTPELTDFLAKHGEKSAVLVSSDFTQAVADLPRVEPGDFVGNRFFFSMAKSVFSI